MRILIVEDEFIAALDLAEIVKSFGHEVVGPVWVPQSAIDLIRSQPIDAALLDINLGTITAISIADELDARGVPYAVVTAYSPENIGVRFKDARYVSKPFRVADIKAAIKDIAASISRRG